MGNFRQNDGLGISWGVRGLRIGKSQYGNWWISVGLPLGFRITKSLGSMKRSQPLAGQPTPTQPMVNPPISNAPPVQIQPLTENQKLLEKMRRP